MQHEVDDVHLGVNLLLHVVVLVGDFTADRSFTVFLVHLLGTLLNRALAVFEAVTVVVADDVVQLGVLHVSLHARQVVEALIALGLLRCLFCRKHRHKLSCQATGVHHLTLGIARMHAYTFYIYLSAGGVEVLKL